MTERPGYMETYESFWARIVEGPDGTLNRDAVARELSDYSFVMEQISIVYSELADLSKPNYHAHAILEVIHEHQEKYYREHYAERLCERVEDEESADVRAVLLELAEEWSPGSWDEYCQMVARLQEVARLQAASSQ